MASVVSGTKRLFFARCTPICAQLVAQVQKLKSTRSKWQSKDRILAGLLWYGVRGRMVWPKVEMLLKKIENGGLDIGRGLAEVGTLGGGLAYIGVGKMADECWRCRLKASYKRQHIGRSEAEPIGFGLWAG